MGRNGDACKLWLIFVKNHREVIAAMDFFTVPAATFRLLYCFFVIGQASVGTTSPVWRQGRSYFLERGLASDGHLCGCAINRKMIACFGQLFPSGHSGVDRFRQRLYK